MQRRSMFRKKNSKAGSEDVGLKQERTSFQEKNHLSSDELQIAMNSPEEQKRKRVKKTPKELKSKTDQKNTKMEIEAEDEAALFSLEQFRQQEEGKSTAGISSLKERNTKRRSHLTTEETKAVSLEKTRKKEKDQEKPKRLPPEKKKISSTRQKSKKTKDEDLSSTLEKEQNQDDVFINVQKEENNVINSDDFSEKPPIWAMKENIQDAKQRKPDDPDYDPSTLYIPPNALDSFTPLMKQYWSIKSQNFDKLLMFRIGDFYRMFYEDALICHRVLDIHFLGSKMICGVPVQSLEKYSHKLINLGFKICVADQVEKAKTVEKEKPEKGQKKQKKGEAKEKIIQRQVSKIMSKGTIINRFETGHEPKYLLSIRTDQTLIAVTYLELVKNTITFGCFQDDENYSMFQTLLSQIRPDEVVFQKSKENQKILEIIKSSLSSVLLSPIAGPQAWSHHVIDKYFPKQSDWPRALVQVENKEEELEKNFTSSSFAGMIAYLEEMLIADQIILTARYESFDPLTYKRSHMILDAQVLQHLEVVDVDYLIHHQVEGSLLSFVDRTVTKFGKRMIRQWILAPLLDVREINQRLSAIEDLETNFEFRDNLCQTLKQLPDFERICSKIYKVSIHREGNVYFDDIPVNNLRSFKWLLESFSKANNFLLKNQWNEEFNSELMQNLTSLVDHSVVLSSPDSRYMPNLNPILKELNDFIVWEGKDQSIPTPKPGADKDYDTVKAEIEVIAQKLKDYLEEIRSRFNGDRTIRYVHIKSRYELEIPSDYVQGSLKPKEFEFTSKRKGYERFVTQEIRDLVEELEVSESKLKSLLDTYLCFVFRYFHSFSRVWDRFISGLATLDCLYSLSLVSFSSEFSMCRPELFPRDGPKVFFEVRDLVHPCISKRIRNFVPNDIILGSQKGIDDQKKVVLLTGPNMGGKSTILRQTAVAAILAQIGCYVPAKSCRMSIVDRIFARIGASDQLIQGKSTFYIELEEALNLIKYGTKNSLAIIDELGRGTSTFDGVSIAVAVLNYLLQKIQCRVLFATHFHILVEELMQENKVGFYHMAYRLNEKDEKVTFLYKLKEGECSKSFGLNIAKIAGIPMDVVALAKEKAIEFESDCMIDKLLRESQKLKKIFQQEKELINCISEDFL